MNVNLEASVDRSIRSAQRRLLSDRFLYSLGVGLTLALTVGLGWFLLEPWVFITPPVNLRWIVLGVAIGLGLVAATLWTVLTRPSRAQAALELDKRFDLRERVTTALGLREEDRSTAAGQAVLADASSKVATLRVAEKFPLKPTWHHGAIPALAGAIALAFFFYHPDTSSASSENPALAAKKKPDTKLPADPKKLPTQPFTKQAVPDQLDRKKSKELEQLEEELNATMEKWKQNEPKNDQEARDKVAELTALEEKVKKHKEMEYQKLKQMEQQLKQLDRMNKDEFPDGPLEDFKKELGKGDLKKADEKLDELIKKAKDKKLSTDDLKNLAKQAGKMKEQVQQDKEKREAKDKLQKKIDDAKKEGKDAEALERELAKLEEDLKKSSELTEEMAKKMEKIQKMANEGKMDELAEELAQLGDQLKNIEGEIQDLEDVDEYLQKLRAELKEA
jgi:hypothetical protein